MDPLTLTTSRILQVAARQAAESTVRSVLRRNKSLILSASATLVFLGTTLASSNYLSRTDRSYGTKILLFLTGVSTSASVYLLTRQSNTSLVLLESVEESDSTAFGSKHSQTVNIENFSGTLVSSDSARPGSFVASGSNVASDSKTDAAISSTFSTHKEGNRGKIATPIGEVLVVEPSSFEELPKASLAVQEGKSVVLNLSIMEPDEAQRAVDFMAGGVYVLGGYQERIGESIFLFTPSDISTSMPSQIVEEISEEIDTSEQESSIRPHLRLLDFSRPERQETSKTANPL